VFAIVGILTCPTICQQTPELPKEPLDAIKALFGTGKASEKLSTAWSFIESVPADNLLGHKGNHTAQSLLDVVHASPQLTAALINLISLLPATSSAKVPDVQPILASVTSSQKPVGAVHGTHPLAPSAMGVAVSQVDPPKPSDVPPEVVWVILLTAVRMNLMMEVLLSIVCMLPIKQLNLWGKCTNPLRAVMCNPLVWWVRPLILHYECSNPCACDADPVTLNPIPGCVGCDFPERIPPSPALSWMQLNMPMKGEDEGMSFLRCSLLSDDFEPPCKKVATGEPPAKKE